MKLPYALSVDSLLVLIGELQARNALLEQQNALLLTRVADLERRLGLDSSNSSKPPSSDGPGQGPRRTRSLRERGVRKPGGQPGHPGKHLKRSEQVDHTIIHRPATCGHCQAALGEEPLDLVDRRQVFDLPAPRPLLVTEHQRYRCRCSGCGAVTTGSFPPEVRAPVQYGARLSAVVTYLSAGQFLPEDRLGQVLTDLFGVTVSAGTIGQMIARAASRTQAFAAAVCEEIRRAPVKHLDETGFWVGATPQWLHVAGTAGSNGLVHYRVSRRRGEVLTQAAHIVMHDHWTSYFQMPGVTHALCNAHHLRELTALVDIDGEAWARRMRTLLRKLCHEVNLALERPAGQTGALPPDKIRAAERQYDRIIRDGIAWHKALPELSRNVKRGRIRRRTGHNLLLRLELHKAAVLLFLRNPAVPFTNNEAERDARMMKLRQKISGGFRTSQGADNFATLRTLIGTARKRGWNMLETLTLCPTQLIHTIRLA
ncbi:IS66 family transposase [Bradyrhizobium sp. HKCCYLR20261]|uniref:IS66 family transposase n=1 Tax=Bradyrhizobium sp. HKCCYLR20261 TaxID=3420760 RepID=UPI003EBA569D